MNENLALTENQTSSVSIYIYIKDAEAFRGARMGSLVDMVKGISRDCGHRPFLWLVVYDFEDHWRDERG
jgi:hypothetical protein